MADIGMGKILDHKEMVKDAVHVAVASVIVSDYDGRLYPGQDVGWDKDQGFGFVSNHNCEEFIGIIDPFLPRSVTPGQRCWLFLYPNSTTPMQHNWHHPAFKQSETSLEAAKKWMTEFAERANISYRIAIQAGHDFNEHEEWYTQYDQDTAREVMGEGSTTVEYWRNWSIITGKPVRDPEGTVFSCSC